MNITNMLLTVIGVTLFFILRELHDLCAIMRGIWFDTGGDPDGTEDDPDPSAVVPFKKDKAA